MSSNLFWYDIWNDGDDSFWTLTNDGVGAITGSIEANSVITRGGTDSLKFTIGAGSNLESFIGHDYGGDTQDWTDYNIVNFMVYASDTGIADHQIFIFDSAAAFSFMSLSSAFSGWSILSVPFNAMTVGGGALDFSIIKTIRYDPAGGRGTGIWYLSRVWLSRYGYDVPRWST